MLEVVEDDQDPALSELGLQRLGERERRALLDAKDPRELERDEVRIADGREQDAVHAVGKLVHGIGGGL